MVNRWNQTDRVERVVNPGQPAEAQPYTYAGANPTNQTDPTGACSQTEQNFLFGVTMVAAAAAIPATFGGSTGVIAAGAAASGWSWGVGAGVAGFVCSQQEEGGFSGGGYF